MIKTFGDKNTEKLFRKEFVIFLLRHSDKRTKIKLKDNSKVYETMKNFKKQKFRHPLGMPKNNRIKG